MDTSASLKDTDPQAARVDAARHLTDRLGEFARGSGASIDVAVAGFSDRFDVTLPWTSLDKGGQKKVSASVERFAKRDSGWETDYWQALQGARSYLADGASADACRALVWLTDGMYDLDRRGSDGETEKYGATKPYLPGVRLTTDDAVTRAEKAGTKDLCRPGGIADALRADGITTLGIGLRGGAEGASFALMSGIATRTKVDGRACGKTSARGRGDFVLAEDVADLFFAFDALADPENPPRSMTTPLCQGEVCAEGRHTFVTDRSIVSASVLGSANLDGYEVMLVTPAGDRFRLAPGKSVEVTRPGFTIRAQWHTDSVFSAKFDRGTGDTWAGSWGVVFVDPSLSGRGEARTNIRLISDLTPTWGQNDDLVAGAKSPLDVGIAVGDGTRLGPRDVAGDLTLDILLDEDGRDRVVLARGLTPADLQQPVVADLTSQRPGSARLLLEMSLATAGSQGTGTPPISRVVGYEVDLRAPGEYPRMSRLIDLGRGDTSEAVKAAITWDGEGCVWLENSAFDVLPGGVTGADLSAEATDQESCVEDELVVTLRPEGVGAGLLSGTAVVKAVPAEGPGEPLDFPVRVRYEMEPPANEVVRWWVFALVFLFGVGLPLLVLAALKKRGATLSGDGAAVAVLRGHVGESSSFLDGVTVQRDKDQIHTFSSRQTSLAVTSRVRLVVNAKAWNPAAAPDVQIVGGPASTSDGSSLPLAVQNTWVAALDPLDPAGEVEVVLIRPISGGGVEELLADARARVPEQVTALRRSAGHVVPGVRTTDEWDATPGHSSPNPTRVEDDEW